MKINPSDKSKSERDHYKEILPVAKRIKNPNRKDLRRVTEEEIKKHDYV